MMLLDWNPMGLYVTTRLINECRSRMVLAVHDNIPSKMTQIKSYVARLISSQRYCVRGFVLEAAAESTEKLCVFGRAKRPEARS